MILHAQTPSVGKFTKSGVEVKFGERNSWINLPRDAGIQRVPVRVKGKTFGLSIQKIDVWIIPETRGPAPHAVVAPVAAEQNNPCRLRQHRKLWRHRGQKRLRACGLSEKPATLQQPGRARDCWDNHSAREDSPVWGTKAQMWPRLVHAEARRELQKRDEAWHAERARELAEAGGQGELRVPRATSSNEPSADERARHEVTHLPYQPWCAWYVMGKGRAKQHLQRPVESVKVPEFEMDFCHLFQDSKKRHQPGHQAWATTLVMVDVTTQNPLCAALSTKSNKNAYP